MSACCVEGPIPITVVSNRRTEVPALMQQLQKRTAANRPSDWPLLLDRLLPHETYLGSIEYGNHWVIYTNTRFTPVWHSVSGPGLEQIFSCFNDLAPKVWQFLDPRCIRAAWLTHILVALKGWFNWAGLRGYVRFNKYTLDCRTRLQKREGVAADPLVRDSIRSRVTDKSSRRISGWQGGFPRAPLIHR